MQQRKINSEVSEVQDVYTVISEASLQMCRFFCLQSSTKGYFNKHLCDNIAGRICLALKEPNETVYFNKH